MVRLDNLYKWLVYCGLDVWTVKDWSTRGSSSFAPVLNMDHWTAGPRGASASSRPSLNVVVYGRPGLPGPLCNTYLARNGSVGLVASGRANHAGYGYWKGVTGNSGTAGTEAEAADNSDWTAAQRRAYPLVNVATLFAEWEKGLISWGQITSNRIVGHSEFALPKGRKIDINGYTMSSMRAQVAALIPGFKARVNRKAIGVGTAPIYDINTGKFIDGVTAPKPVTERKSWFEMASINDLQKAVADLPITVIRSDKKTTRSLSTILSSQDADHGRFAAKLADIEARLAALEKK